MSRFARLLPIFCLTGFALLVGPLPGGARAGEEPPAGAPAVAPGVPDPAAVRARVAGWLADLSSDEFKVREAARTGLKRDGLKARDLLEAVAESEDPEVRRTVAAILAREAGATRTRPADVRPGDFDALGRVSLNVRNEPFADALASLGERLGAHFALPEGFEAPPVTLALDDVPSFQALGALLGHASLRMPKPFERGGSGVLVRSRKAAVAPYGVAGPMRATVLEVSATRSFGAGAAPRFAVKLRLDWAPYVQVVQWRTPTVEVARDPAGKAYKASPAMNTVRHHGLGSNARSLTLDIHLIPGHEDCQAELAALEFTLPMTLRYDRAQLELADAARIPITLDAAGKPAERGQEESVSFLSLEESTQGRGQWILEYAAVLSKEVAQKTLQAYVREEDGGLTPLYVAGGRSRGADGTVRITARAYRGTKAKPKAFLVTWHRREEEGTLRFRVADIPLR